MKLKKRIVVFELSSDGTRGNIISLKDALEKYPNVLLVNLEKGSWCFKKELKMIGESRIDNPEDQIIGVYDCTKIEHLNRIIHWNKKLTQE